MDTNTCRHEYLFQFSTQYVRSLWTRVPDGTYDPPSSNDKVLDEDTDYFECMECEKRLYLEADGRLAEDEDEEDVEVG